MREAEAVPGGKSAVRSVLLAEFRGYAYHKLAPGRRRGA